MGEGRRRLNARLRDAGRRVEAMARRRVPRLDAVLRHLLNVRIAESATVIAAKTFATFFPVLFVFAAFAPDPLKDQLKKSLRSTLGLHGESLQQFSTPLTAPSDGTLQAFGLAGLVIIICSATSCSRSVQSLVDRCWDMPKASAKDLAWRWVAWLGGLLAYLIASGLLRDGLGGGLLLGQLLSIPVGVAFWWWTQRLLLAGRIGWLPLLPGAILCGVSMDIWLLASRVYVPAELNRSTARYGSLGLVFALLSWLLTVGFILTISLATGSLTARWPPLNRWLGTPPAQTGSRVSGAGG